MKKTFELSPSATVVDLSFKGLKATGIEALVPALATLTQLQSLDLRFNDLGAAGIQALVPALAKLTQLQSLNLGGNGLEPAGIEALLPALATLTQLQSLDLSGNRLKVAGIQALVPALAKLTQLQSLNLSGNGFRVAGIQALVPTLAKLTQLQSLDLGGNLLEVVAIKALLPALATLTQLQSLELSGNYLGADGIQALVPALAKLTQLQSLNLGGNGLKVAAIEALVPALATLTQLQSLYLHNNDLKEADIKALVPALAKLTQLQSLDLSANGLEAAGIKALAPTLATLTQLQSLNLCRNHLVAADIEALVPALATLTQLQSLELSGNDLGAAGMQALAPTLATLTQLQSLGLRGNRLGAVGIKALAPVLAKLTQLQSLHLSGNDLEATDIEALVPALATLTQLQSLHLHNNRLKAADIEALVPALATLTRLQSLHLSSNDLDVNSQQLIDTILTRNQNIQLITQKIQSHIDQLTHQTHYPSTPNKPDTIDEDLDTLFSIAEEIKTQYHVEPQALYDTYYQLNCALALAREDFGTALQAAHSMQTLPLKLLLSYTHDDRPMIVATVLRELVKRSVNASNNPSDMLDLLPCLIRLTPTQNFLSEDERYRLILSVAQLADPLGTNTNVKNLLHVVDRLPERYKRLGGDQEINYQQLLIESYGDNTPPNTKINDPQSAVIGHLTTMADHYEKRGIAQTIRSVISQAPAEMNTAPFFATQNNSGTDAKVLEATLKTLEQSEKNIGTGLLDLITWLKSPTEITPGSLKEHVTQALMQVIPIDQSTNQTATQQRDALCELLQKRYFPESPTPQFNS